MGTSVLTGVERFLREEGQGASFAGKRIGLLSNQAATTTDLQYVKDALHSFLGEQLTCLFSPQHGFFSEKQDNMIESDHYIDQVTSLPVFSLYGETRKPTPEMMENLDVLFIDLVDVGTRVYTFMYTMAYCLEAAKEAGKQVVVLDRPNPISGSQVEGNILDTEYTSFVGLYPIPMRHGMTFGELALFFNNEFGIKADLQVIEMKGWTRDMYFEETGLPWIFPSPNMPTVATAVVYPGQVIWEGTNISEGRGTTLPFELVGSPYLDQEKILAHLNTVSLPGCYFRPICFEPTSGKWKNEVCKGFHLHVTDRKVFLPYRTSLALYQAIFLAHPISFEYKEPPYEYEYVKLPMDMILGDRKLRENLEAGVPLSVLEEDWSVELEKFLSSRKKYLLYPDEK